MNNSQTLIDRAAQLIKTGRNGAARPILAAVSAMGGRDPRAAELGALLDMRDGHLSAARDALDRDLSVWPGHAGLRKLRAELRFNTEDLAGALEDAADCVIQDAHDPAAKALLGMLLLESGHAKDAILCLAEAVRDAPFHPGYVQALAKAQEADGDVHGAANTLRLGTTNMPGDGSLRSAAVFLAVRQRDFGQAIVLAEAARVAGVADACTFGLLGHALSSLGQHSGAADAYQEALKLGPDDPYVRHLVAASGVIASADRAPDQYVRTLFDGYAARFEDHLIGLGYRVPGLVRATLLQHRPGLHAGQSIGPFLDLGCGTGLVGVALSDLLVHPAVGVDLSPRMLEGAAQKKIYTELHEEELGTFLRREARNFPLIIAADVLCYFGALEQILSEIAQRMTNDGIFIFTVEELTAEDQGKPWMLGRQGRFAHSVDYVRSGTIRAGFRIRALQHESLRKEAGMAVPGLIVTLERAP